MKPTETYKICEDILIEGKKYNIEHEILPSENAVADRLLAQRTGLLSAYAELHKKLCAHHLALKRFLDLLLSVAAFWSPEQNIKARAGRTRLEKVNHEIASKAAELAKLLDERSDLHDRAGFYSDTHYSVVQVIEAAASENHLYDIFIKDKIAALGGQFDLKYWPTLGDFLRELMRDAEEAEVQATDRLTEAATSATRSGLADFFKALFTSIEDHRRQGFLPLDFRLTDASLASLASCSLDLEPEETVDATFVKRFRQRERAQIKA